MVEVCSVCRGLELVFPATPVSRSRFTTPSPKLVALQEDLAIIITHTKRVRRRGASPPPSGRHKDS